MLTITIEKNKCYINNKDVLTGFILDSNNLSNEDLVELYLWCYSIIDSRAKGNVKYGN